MTTMRAIRAHTQGGPETLVFEYAPVPVVGPRDALVRVHAAAITPTEFLWPETWAHPDGTSRLPIIPSHEVCGVVAELGADTSGLAIGDEVFGLTAFDRDGAAAEYVTVAADALARKPKRLDVAQTAALPLSALTAWQALHEHGRIRSGQHVLVLGGAGGVGSFGVQLAVAAGARVSATCSGKDRDFVRQLGATTVLDYASEPVERHLSDVDLVLDTVGPQVARAAMASMRPGGAFVSVAVAEPDREAARPDIRLEWFIVKQDRAGLTSLAELADRGALSSNVAGIYPLADARLAYEQGLRGGNRGKIVLQVV
ncbi:NADP-dependent oxidoreductase [Pendulispora rubella]|uniref:NADP-dependent oxidoreductase n=1 Tax=Pendulispora rubella TaxID=2741070 RepID=A0ABZ2L475_9BACT